jgi:uncharacterized Zn-binding protein involved in type VI secretion
MPQAATLSSIAKSDHIHIEKLCPLCILLPIVVHTLHVVLGPVVSGSNNVFINGKPAARVMDLGVAVPCCSSNTYAIVKGSSTVFINDQPAARIGDMTLHCGIYPGQLITNGSPNVFIGDSRNMGFGFPGITARSDIPEHAHPHEISKAASNNQSSAAAGQPTDASDPQVAKWRLMFSDGQIVQGAVSDFQGAAGRKSSHRSEEGMHQIENLESRSFYSVDVKGTKSLRGRVVDEDDQPICGAAVHVHRAFGEDREFEVGADGSFVLEGLIKDEPCIVSVKKGKHAIGRFVDEAGKAVSATELWIHLADGTSQSLAADSNGKFEHRHPLTGEGFAIEVIKFPAHAKGKFVDDVGSPIGFADILIRRSDGSVIHASTDHAGGFDVDGLLPGEHYSVELLKTK